MAEIEALNRNTNPHNPSDDDASGSDETDPILAAFIDAGKKLSVRQQKREKLTRISRDITAESKRIIFILHEVVTRKRSQAQIINDAKCRIQRLIRGQLRAICMELQNAPAQYYSRAITAGLQEFVEARSLCSFIEHKRIITYSEVKNEMTYNLRSKNGVYQKVTTPLPYQDYMLGLADLTGEMMRRAFRSIGSGETQQCVDICNVLRQLYAGFVGLSRAGPVLSSKLYITRANVHKVENAMYDLHIRDFYKLGKLSLAEWPEPLSRAESPEPPSRAESPELHSREESPEPPSRAESPEPPSRAESPEPPSRAESPEPPSRAESPQPPSRVESPQPPSRAESPEPKSREESPLENSN